MGKELCEQTFAEVETNSSTEIDTDASSSVEAEANDKAVNLCDVLKEFMQKYPECTEEAIEEDNLDASLAEAKSALLSASFDGRLEAALAEITAARASRPVQDVFSTEEPLSAQTNQETSMEELRGALRKTFSAAAFDGRLEGAVKAVKQAKVQEAKAKPSMDALRLTLQHSLSQAAIDGRLVHAIQQTKEESRRENFSGLRRELRQVLLQAADDGTLEEALESTAQLSVESLRRKAQESILEGLSNGRLAETLASLQDEKNSTNDEMQSLRVRVQETMSKAAADGRLEAALLSSTGSEESIEDVRLLAQQTLSCACGDGSLEQVFQQMRKENEEAAAAEALRDKLKNTFRDAVATRSLGMAFKSAQEDSWSALRSKVRQTLTAAAYDGRLEAAWMDVKESSALEDVRAKVQHAFVKAASKGRLEQVLSQVREQPASKEESLDELRAKLQKTFSNAAANGRLGEAFSRIQHQQAPDKGSLESLPSKLPMQQQDSTVNIDALRSDLRGMFADAAQSGILQSTMELIRDKQEASTSGANPLDALRTQARHALCEAASDGRLATVTTDISMTQTEDALRAHTRQTIAEAVSNGSLAKALGDLKISRAENAPSFEEIRLRARAALSSAANEGILTRAFEDCRRPPVHEVPTPKPTLSFSSLTAKLRATFFGATKDGSLATALQQVKAPAVASSEDQLVGKLRSSFLGAASSGRLASAFQEIKQAKFDVAKEAGSVPAKPTIAKGITRPSRQYARAVATKLVPPVNIAAVCTPEAEVMTPKSASKRNRRIIGSFARLPTSDEPPPAENLSPAPGTPRRKSMVPAFRMDIYGASTTGDSSRPRGYDDGFEDMPGSAWSQWSIPAPHGVNHLRVQPGCKLRSSSHTSLTPRTSHIANSHSAMLMDLEEETPRPSQSVRSPRTSQSLGAVRVTKASSMLPPIAPVIRKNKVAASAFTVDMGLIAHQWDVPCIR